MHTIGQAFAFLCFTTGLCTCELLAKSVSAGTWLSCLGSLLLSYTFLLICINSPALRWGHGDLWASFSIPLFFSAACCLP